MLLRHSAIYFLAQGIPGIINLLALALYSRLLSPDEYGKYALVIAGAGLTGAFLFLWLHLGLLRFLSAYPDRRHVFLSTILTSFMILALVAVSSGVGVWLFVGDAELRTLICLGIGFLCMQAFFDLNQEIARSNLTPTRYGIAVSIKSAFSLLLGWFFLLRGLGVTGLILGGIVATTLALIWQIRPNWRGVSLRHFDPGILRQLLAYGTPLILTFALGYVVSSSDRFILSWLLGVDAAGLYSVGYNFAQQTIVVLMMVVNLAAYPLAVRALEERGEGAAREQLVRNGSLLMAISIPAVVGLIMLAPNITGVFLGSAFQDAAVGLMPWIATGALLAGFKSFHLDLSFQLGRRTIKQVWVVLTAAVVNVALNFWWIPLFGIYGSAYSTVVAYIIAMGHSWLLGRKIFPVPVPLRPAGKIVLATSGMAAALLPFVEGTGVWQLSFQILWGVLVYGALLAALNLESLREHWPATLRKRWGYRL